jgi:hypothetical protein
VIDGIVSSDEKITQEDADNIAALLAERLHQAPICCVVFVDTYDYNWMVGRFGVRTLSVDADGLAKKILEVIKTFEP